MVAMMVAMVVADVYVIMVELCFTSVTVVSLLFTFSFNINFISIVIYTVSMDTIASDQYLIHAVSMDTIASDKYLHDAHVTNLYDFEYESSHLALLYTVM